MKEAIKSKFEKSDIRLANLGFFAMLYMTCSFAIVNEGVIPNSITKIIWMGMLTIFLLHIDSIMVRLVAIWAVMLGCMAVSTIINREPVPSLINIVVSWTTAMVYAQIVEFKDFYNAIISVMYTICIISLIGFTVYSLIPSMCSINPVHGRYSNLFLFVYRRGLWRNFGLFWEPGAFQTFINLALILECIRKDVRVKYVLIFAVTILTTFSTTGYLAFAVAVIMMMSKRGVDIKYRLLVMFAAGILGLYIFLNQDDFFAPGTIFGKLIHTNLDSVNTFSTRFYSIGKPFECFLKSPIWGTGYYNLKVKTFEYTAGLNTFTLVNLFAVYGIIYACAAIMGIGGWIKRCCHTNMEELFFSIVIIIISSSENYVQNPMLFLLVLFGIKEMGLGKHGIE